MAKMVKVGDAVRLKPTSILRDLLEPWADDVWRVARTYQDDDDDGLRISVALGERCEGYTSPLSAEEFEPDQRRPGEPF